MVIEAVRTPDGKTETQPMHDTLKHLLITAILTTSVAGAQDEDILRPEQAYRYAVADTGSTIEVDWVVEDGYYLYRNKMS